MDRPKEIATFAAGCFWGVEAEFRKIKGVTSTKVGYTGGRNTNPSYEDVSTGGTGHAESVRIEFDPKEIGYEQLLEVFWKIHDPTTLNRQGPDIGSQYRSVIFYHNGEQKKLAVRSKEKRDRSGIYKKSIATEIVEADVFYDAEEYHQRYFEKRGMRGCRL